MRALQRARLVLVLAGALALALVIVELPLSTLVHQRAQLAAASGQLAAVRAENTRLAGEISDLRSPATVAAIAHAQYGLIKPGQIEYEIPHLPGTNTGTSSLAFPRVATKDLVPPTASPYGAPPSAPRTTHRPTQGLWSQILGRLAFWRGSF